MTRVMHSGTLTLDRNGRFRGMANGTVIVAAGVTADIAGMINGTLVVEKDADVCVSGMINGCIDNRGGRVSVTGMVTG